MRILLRARFAPPATASASTQHGPEWTRSWRVASAAVLTALLVWAATPALAQAACGDGILDSGEQCDDRDTTSGDGCSAACQIEDGWTCGPGSPSPTPSTCTEICGDGQIVGRERCDDGNQSGDPQDGCSSLCRIDRGWRCDGTPSVCGEVCGNGIITPGEQCDPGLDVNGDCCSAQCQIFGSGTECRAAAGVCDAADTCDGTSPLCPDAKPKGNVCRSSGGACDVEERCDGFNNDCPANSFALASLVCRAAGGNCDATERCTGTSAVCPADLKRPEGDVCRVSLSACDPAETCDGVNNACPAQGPFAPEGTLCRDQAGDCDVAEVCSGTSPFCPTDRIVGQTCDELSPVPGAPCTADAGCQDAEHPNGGCGDTVCREPSDACDQPEVCDGASTACPPERVCNTASSNRGAGCTSDEDCPGGACSPAPVKNAFATCRAVAGPCDQAERCDGTNPECPADLTRPANTVCRRAAGDCDLAEQCDGVAAACPADVVVPEGQRKAAPGETEGSPFVEGPCRFSRDLTSREGNCDFDDFCDGVNPACENNSAPNFTPCIGVDLQGENSTGLFCDGEEVCLFGQCVNPASGACVGGTCIEGPPPTPPAPPAGTCVICGDGSETGDEECGEPGTQACPVGKVCSSSDCRCIDPGPQLSADPICGFLDSGLVVPVSLAANGAQVSSLGFTLNFPNTLEAPDNTTFGVTCPSAVADLGFNCQGIYSGRQVQVLVSPPVGPLPVPTLPDGVVVNIRLQVRPNADTGGVMCSSLECLPLDLANEEFGDPSGQSIAAGSAVDGCADVVECEMGDCNGNNNLTTADVTCTIQRIFGQTDQTSPCEDCNGDSELTSADVTCTVLCLFGACPAR